MQAYTAPSGAIDAVVRERGTGKFLVTDISGIRLIDLYNLYLVLEAPIIDSFDNELTVDMFKHYRTAMMNSTMTFEEWLTFNGDNALITTEGFPSLELDRVNYVSGFYNKGTYQLSRRGWHPSNEAAIEDMTDVIIDLEGVEPVELYQNSLFSFNGFFLPTEYHEYGVRVRDAGAVVRRSKSLSFGLLNFERVGKVQISPISESQIQKVNDELSYHEKVIIGTDVSLTGKTVGMVIGGHLHLLDGVVKVIGDKSVIVSMRNFHYIDRIIEAKEVLDLSFMGWDDAETRVNVPEVLNDELIKKYLSCQYSFLVIIDNPNMYREVVWGDHNVGLTKCHIDDIDEISWVADRNGRTVEFWPINEVGQWVLNYDRLKVPNYAAKSMGWEGRQFINDAHEIGNPIDLTHLFLFRFSARV